MPTHKLLDLRILRDHRAVFSNIRHIVKNNLDVILNLRYKINLKNKEIL